MMKFAVHLTLAVAALTAAAAPALHAQTLQQREMIAADKKEVQEHLDAANKTCGSNVQIITDYSTFADVKTAPENTNQQSPYAFIVNVTDAMDSVCRGSADAKAAVASKLKTVKVRHSTTESESFSNGVLTYAVPYTGATVQTLMDLLRSKL